MYVGEFISKIRQRTGQTRYAVDASGNPTEGIPQATVIDFINEAEQFLQAAVVATQTTLCDVSEDIDLVANQQSYTLTDNIHFGNQIRNVQYSFDGEERNFRDLPQLRDEYRRAHSVSDPYGYIRRGSSIDLVGIPSRAGGVLRVWFPRQWDEINFRIGQITSKNATPTTEITLDNDSYLDALALATCERFCIVNLYGTVLDYDCQATSYNSGTRVLTIPSQTLVGTTGHFLVLGRFSTTHLDVALPTTLVQQYVKIEAQMRMFDQKASVEAIRESKHLVTRYNAIIEAFQNELLDQTDIPIDDPTLV